MTVITLPPPEANRVLTEDDLPDSDGIPMDSERQRHQMNLLIEPLATEWRERQDFYVGGNMFVYFSRDRLLTEDFRGPDVFVALGVPKRERKSWVVWIEGKAPDVVIEVLSETTESIDRTTKKKVYQDDLKVPEYYWHDPFDRTQFSGFSLQSGVYVPMVQQEPGRLVSQVLQLALVVWDGVYAEIEASWLRWARLDGTLLPTGQEQLDQTRRLADRETQRAEHENLRAEQERQRAEQERQRADRLAQKLREMGIDPDL